MEGVTQAIFDSKGNQIGTKRTFSDLLLIFRLKAESPEKYRECYEVTHQVGPDAAIALHGVLIAAARELGLDPESTEVRLAIARAIRDSRKPKE